MKQLMKLKRIHGDLMITMIIAILLVVSCHNHKANETPTELTISFIPDEDIAAKVNRLEPIANYLKKKLKLKKVSIVKCTNYAAVIEAMKAQKVDIAYYGQFSYLLAHDKANAEAFAMVGSSKGRRTEYCVIIVNSKFPIYNMDDLKKQASHLNIGFSDPASTTGHIIPRAYLDSVGLNPEKSFKNMYFSSSQAASIFMLKSGELDVICIGNSSISKMVVKGKMKQEDVRVIWKSQGILPSPVAIRANFPSEFKEKVRQAYLDLPKEAPDAWRNYVDKQYLYYGEDIRKDLIYIASYDSLYNEIRNKVSKLNMKDILNK